MFSELGRHARFYFFSVVPVCVFVFVPQLLQYAVFETVSKTMFSTVPITPSLRPFLSHRLPPPPDPPPPPSPRRSLSPSAWPRQAHFSDLFNSVRHCCAVPPFLKLLGSVQLDSSRLCTLGLGSAWIWRAQLSSLGCASAGLNPACLCAACVAPAVLDQA